MSGMKIVVAFLLCGWMMGQEREGPALHGIRLGESQKEAKQQLARMGAFIRADEGNEAWKLKNDPDADSILVGFDADRRVRYVNLIAKADHALKCAELGANPKQNGGTGSIEFTNPVGDADDHVLAIARGTSRDHLNMCALKRVGAKSQEDEEEEREHRERKKH